MGSLENDDAILPVSDVGGGGPGPLTGAVTVRRPDPRQQYVVGGNHYLGTSVPQVLPESIDDLTRAFGFSAYDALMAIPAVSSSINTLKLGIMAGDMQITETHPAPFYKKTLTPEQKLSADVRDFCERMLNRIPGLRGVFLQMLDAVLYGNKLAEKTADIAEYGPDMGRMVLKTLTVKKRNAWMFVVDNTMNVTGILAKGMAGKPFQLLPSEKFVWLTWWPHNNDPRGTSVARPAYAPANLSVQLYAQYFKYLKQFAGPSLICTTAPEAESVVDSDTGHILTPEMVMLAQAELFQNGSVFVIPFGAEVTPIYVQGNGEAFLKGFDFLDRQMVHGILGQTRATMEAEHGSKADSEQGDSILNLLTTYGRDLFGEVIRNMILKQFVALNWNQEVADLYTPYVYFGSVNPKNTVAMWNALSNAKKAGLLTASTEQEWCARADAPIPDPEVDQAAQKAQMEQEAKIAGKPQDAPGGPSGGGNDGSDQEDQENAYRASAGSTRWWNLRNRRGLFSGYRKTG
jgi:hypothetical protein